MRCHHITLFITQKLIVYPSAIYSRVVYVYMSLFRTYIYIIYTYSRTVYAEMQSLIFYVFALENYKCHKSLDDAHYLLCFYVVWYAEKPYMYVYIINYTPRTCAIKSRNSYTCECVFFFRTPQ